MATRRMRIACWINKATHTHTHTHTHIYSAQNVISMRTAEQKFYVAVTPL
jgi:hypothetical protein